MSSDTPPSELVTVQLLASGHVLCDGKEIGQVIGSRFVRSNGVAIDHEPSDSGVVEDRPYFDRNDDLVVGSRGTVLVMMHVGDDGSCYLGGTPLMGFHVRGFRADVRRAAVLLAWIAWAKILAGAGALP
ncbi:MAG: hypothetical protein NVS3B20_16330 [Polyangiales bacterium]